MEFLQGCY